MKEIMKITFMHSYDIGSNVHEWSFESLSIRAVVIKQFCDKDPFRNPQTATDPFPKKYGGNR